jgi:hypothetical protein
MIRIQYTLVRYYYEAQDYILQSKIYLLLLFIKIELIFIYNPKAMATLVFKTNNKGWKRRINIRDYVL